jgi:hypothetical protein
LIKSLKKQKAPELRQLYKTLLKIFRDRFPRQPEPEPGFCKDRIHIGNPIPDDIDLLKCEESKMQKECPCTKEDLKRMCRAQGISVTKKKGEKPKDRKALTEACLTDPDFGKREPPQENPFVEGYVKKEKEVKPKKKKVLRFKDPSEGSEMPEKPQRKKREPEKRESPSDPSAPPKHLLDPVEIPPKKQGETSGRKFLNQTNELREVDFPREMQKRIDIARVDREERVQNPEERFNQMQERLKLSPRRARLLLDQIRQRDELQDLQTRQIRIRPSENRGFAAVRQAASAQAGGGLPLHF